MKPISSPLQTRRTAFYTKGHKGSRVRIHSVSVWRMLNLFVRPSASIVNFLSRNLGQKGSTGEALEIVKRNTHSPPGPWGICLHSYCITDGSCGHGEGQPCTALPPGPARPGNAPAPTPTGRFQRINCHHPDRHEPFPSSVNVRQNLQSHIYVSVHSASFCRAVLR